MGDSARVTLVLVDAFVTVTAVGGGIALAAGAEHERFPLEWLRGTPFHGYMVPGLLLAGVVGGAAAVATAAALGSRRAAGPASVLAGAVLVGWIAGENRMLKRPLSAATLWEAFYAALGLLMVVLGLVVRRGRARNEHRSSRAGKE